MKIKYGRSSLVVGVVYRPPENSAIIAVNVLDNILSFVNAKYDKILVVGDVNLNLGDVNLKLFNIKNCISERFDTSNLV